ncbi:MAG: formate dehydrogenase accessory protein FdhE [Desulfohalobiaceae bacterium]
MQTEKQSRSMQRILQELHKQEDLPEQLVQLVEDMVSLQSRTLAETQVPLPKKEDLTEASRHVQGLPLLPRQSFPFDHGQAESLLEQAWGILEKDVPYLQEALHRLQKMLADKKLEPQALFQAYLEDSQEAFQAWSEEFPEAPGMPLFLARSSLSPSLYKVAEHVNQLHPQDRVWEYGYCPVCGSLPLICLLRDQGQRYGCCSFCGTQYHIPRLGCVYCGEQDAARQDYVYSEEVQGFRVDVCGSCSNYIKTADFRQMDRHYLPELDDLQSLALDLVAQEKGYTRPTLSAWGF